MAWYWMGLPDRADTTVKGVTPGGIVAIVLPGRTEDLVDDASVALTLVVGSGGEGVGSSGESGGSGGAGVRLCCGGSWGGPWGGASRFAFEIRARSTSSISSSISISALM